VPDAARARVAGPLATAFAHTYWWAMAVTALALVPAAVLAVTERRAGSGSGEAAPAGPVAAEGAMPSAPDRPPRPGRAPAPLR
jgi:hypothetical protein